MEDVTCHVQTPKANKSPYQLDLSDRSLTGPETSPSASVLQDELEEGEGVGKKFTAYFTFCILVGSLLCCGNRKHTNANSVSHASKG